MSSSDNLRRNILSGYDVREHFPKISRRRTEYCAFMEGVVWLLHHLHSYRFVIEPEGDADEKNNDQVVLAAIEQAKAIYPDYDPLPAPSKSERPKTGDHDDHATPATGNPQPGTARFR